MKRLRQTISKCLPLLFLLVSCINNSEDPREVTFLRIDSYKSVYADTIGTHTYRLFEEIKGDTISLYHWDIDTFSTAIYDEEWNLAFGDTTTRIDTFKVGWVLVNTPFKIRLPYGPYHKIDESIYNLGKDKMIIQAYCDIPSNSDDADQLIFYNEDLGILAFYALNWGNIMLLTELNDRNLNKVLHELTPHLQKDSTFFPIPQKVKEFYESLSNKTFRPDILGFSIGDTINSPVFEIKSYDDSPIGEATYIPDPRFRVRLYDSKIIDLVYKDLSKQEHKDYFVHFISELYDNPSVHDGETCSGLLKVEGRSYCWTDSVYLDQVTLNHSDSGNFHASLSIGNDSFADSLYKEYIKIHGGDEDYEFVYQE